MPAPMKENGIQIDIEQDLLADAISQTHGQPYTDDEIELLALDHELTDFQQLQIEIHDELRGGSVRLNRFLAFSKWFSALVMPLPLRASAG